MNGDSDGLALELRRTIEAPRAAVFKAFTDQDALAEWWGPEGFSIPSIEFPAREGEVYRIEMSPPEGAPFFLVGEFREVSPPGRLVFTFVWEEPDPDDVEMCAELGFEDLGDSTRVTLRQAPFMTEARQALHRDGWGDSFDKLEAFLRRA